MEMATLAIAIATAATAWNPIAFAPLSSMASGPLRLFMMAHAARPTRRSIVGMISGPTHTENRGREVRMSDTGTLMMNARRMDRFNGDEHPSALAASQRLSVCRPQWSGCKAHRRWDPR